MESLDTLFKISLFKAFFYVIFHSLHFFHANNTTQRRPSPASMSFFITFSSSLLHFFLLPIIAKHFSLSFFRVYSSFLYCKITINHEREWNLNKKITKQQKKKVDLTEKREVCCGREKLNEFFILIQKFWFFYSSLNNEIMILTNNYFIMMI